MSENHFGDLARRDQERHLLAAVDESENSRRAVMFLADFFCGHPEVFITLLAVIPEPSEDFFATGEERQTWLTERRAVMNKALADYSLILISAGFADQQISCRVAEKKCTSIGDVILEEQDKLRCCIVVMGRRGMSHDEEFLFGSTSNKILHHARNCAVMVVE
jgi:nucleotide-binding universal stress UspA family protein